MKMIRVECGGSHAVSGHTWRSVQSMVGILADPWPVRITADDAEVFTGTAKEAREFVARGVDEEAVKCRVCGRRAPLDFPPVFFHFHDGWQRHNPTCRHDSWHECPDCQAAPEPAMGTPERKAHFAIRNCPVCGCDGEFT